MVTNDTPFVMWDHMGYATIASNALYVVHQNVKLAMNGHTNYVGALTHLLISKCAT